jgi:hypothetical protein
MSRNLDFNFLIIKGDEKLFQQVMYCPLSKKKKKKENEKMVQAYSSRPGHA